MKPREWSQTPSWHRTGDAYFPAAAEVEGCWWVLRINSFPDHPMSTLFIDGHVRGDLDDTPPAWGEPWNPSNPPLDPAIATRVIESVKNFVAYGSEVGQPCDNPFCCG